MNEIEDKKFSCVCGSEVKYTNRKAHEKTKKHTNFLLSNPSSSSSGFNNVMPMINLPAPKQPRKKYVRQVQEDEEDYEDDEQDGDDQEQGDEEDGDEFEEELIQALDVIHKGVDDLVADKINLRNDLRLNLHKTVTDVGFLLNPLLNTINDNTKSIQSQLTNVCERLKDIENFLLRSQDSAPCSTGPTSTQSKWINDKCTQRN